MQENHPSDQAQQIRQPEEVSAGRPEAMVTPDAQMTERQAKARLRHRVIGGLVLVATAVVFLPLVFETPANSATSSNLIVFFSTIITPLTCH